MRFVIYIMIFISAVFSQTSSLSMYGFGEYVNSYDASSIALGDSKYFTGLDNRINFSSCSSYWKSTLSNLMVSIAVNRNDFATEKLIENNFQMFSFTFPINENKVFGLGMNPIIRTDIDISESNYTFIGNDNSPNDSPLAYNTDYSFNGGMSEFFILYSSKISKNISFGFRWSKIFGVSKYKYYLNLYDVSFDQNENIQYSLNNVESFFNNNKYSSNKYLLELRYEIKKIEMVFSYARSKPLNIELTPYYDSLGYLETESYYINDKLYEKGIGVKYNINNNLSVLFEQHIFNTFNSFQFLNILNSKSPDISSFHFGLSYKLDNASNSILNQAVIKFGLYNKSYDFSDSRFFDNGMTIGLGAKYFNNKNFIDIAFKIGKRSTEYIEFNSEEYYKLILTLVSGEKWFVNERRK